MEKPPTHHPGKRANTWADRNTGMLTRTCSPHPNPRPSTTPPAAPGNGPGFAAIGSPGGDLGCGAARRCQASGPARGGPDSRRPTDRRQIAAPDRAAWKLRCVLTPSGSSQDGRRRRAGARKVPALEEARSLRRKAGRPAHDCSPEPNVRLGLFFTAASKAAGPNDPDAGVGLRCTFPPPGSAPKPP